MAGYCKILALWLNSIWWKNFTIESGILVKLYLFRREKMAKFDDKIDLFDEHLTYQSKL